MAERSASATAEATNHSVTHIESTSGSPAGRASASTETKPSKEAQLHAALVASALGDAIGYRHGRWEFCDKASVIATELAGLGGALAIHPVKADGWPVSDDTIQHVATLQAFLDCRDSLPLMLADEVEESGGGWRPSRADARKLDRLMASMAARHVSSWSKMGGRAPGGTCGRGIALLKAPGATWDTAVPWKNAANAGCGSAMRSMAIGVVYSDPKFRRALVATAAESASLSHHSLGGCAGAVISALGCALVIQGVPEADWPGIIVEEALPMLRGYLLGRPADRRPDPTTLDALVEEFSAPWKALSSSLPCSIEDLESPKRRDAVFTGYGGGWDALSAGIISYLAFRFCGDSWERFIHYAAVHGGDSDSTGAIAGAWFGAKFGLASLPTHQCREVEFASSYAALAEGLSKAALGD
jgi:ADP-ribosylarginine hydrolase